MSATDSIREAELMLHELAHPSECECGARLWRIVASHTPCSTWECFTAGCHVVYVATPHLVAYQAWLAERGLGVIRCVAY